MDYAEAWYDLSDMSDANQSDAKAIPRGKRGHFLKGQAPKSPGRPPGSISIIAKIKKKFEENPAYFEEWVDKLLEDSGNRRAVMEQIDGRPSQSIDHTTNGKELPTPILLNVPSDDSRKED